MLLRSYSRLSIFCPPRKRLRCLEKHGNNDPTLKRNAAITRAGFDSFANSAATYRRAFQKSESRSIGPAVMGGRVSDIAIDPHNPFVFYVGLGHGGVFKTNDNGVTFEPIFDKQPMLSIGAIAVAPFDSEVVWVGTGEANDRNSSDWGDGVYRSTDGGQKWQNVGLKEGRTIARLVVDRKKPEVAYVAAMGNLWKDGGERGLFKTTDAGKTWKLILRGSSA
jgi:photosystem II stability/assembly factor-like uncharacterized protein